MKRLLAIEYLKVKHTKSFWIFSLLLVIALVSLPVATKYWLLWMETLGEKIGDFVPTSLPFFDFVDIWQNLTYIYKFFSILLGFLVMISVTTEYSNTTVRQNIIDGLSKREFLLSKILWVLLLSAATTLLVFIIGLISGLMWSPVVAPEFIFANIHFLGAYFLHLSAFLLLCMMVALLIRRTGFTIAFMVFYILILEPIATAYTRYNLKIEWLADSFPRSATLALIPNPFGKYLLMEVKDFVPMSNLFILLAWAAVFILFSYYLLRKRDL